MTSTPTVAVAGGASAWRAVPLLTALGARQNVDVTVWSGESASSCPAVVDLLAQPGMTGSVYDARPLAAD